MTYVLIATDTPLDTAKLVALDGGDGTSALAQQLLSAGEVQALLDSGPQVVLTDRFAPVDQMLAPVARGARE